MDKFALTFPGQGPQHYSMIDKVKNMEAYEEYYPFICELLGVDIGVEIRKNSLATFNINSNKISSLLTVFVSYVCFVEFQKKFSQKPDYLAGYSIGQLLALAVGKSISPLDLFTLVAIRADFMDRCFINPNVKMVSIIGVKEEIVSTICVDIKKQKEIDVYVSNFNAPNLVTISGIDYGVDLAVKLIKEFNPIRVIDLPLSGAWHCPLLEPAKIDFEEYLMKVKISHPMIPTLNNVSGLFFENGDDIRKQLAMHLVSPVRGSKGVQKIIENGCSRFIEIGHGNMLSKFGKFINRSAAFETFDGKNLCAE